MGENWNNLYFDRSSRLEMININTDIYNLHLIFSWLCLWFSEVLGGA